MLQTQYARLGLTVLLAWMSVLGAPFVAKVQGSISNGNTIAVTGINFGANGPDVVLFHDFENAAAGSSVPYSANVGTWSSHKHAPSITNLTSVSGTKAYCGTWTSSSPSEARAGTRSLQTRPPE